MDFVKKIMQDWGYHIWLWTTICLAHVMQKPRMDIYTRTPFTDLKAAFDFTSGLLGMLGYTNSLRRDVSMPNTHAATLPIYSPTLTIPATKIKAGSPLLHQSIVIPGKKKKVSTFSYCFFHFFIRIFAPFSTEMNCFPLPLALMPSLLMEWDRLSVCAVS